jgi:hypothetical protein
MQSRRLLSLLLLAGPGLSLSACDVPDPVPAAPAVETVGQALFIGDGNCHQTNFTDSDVALYVDDQYRGRCVRVNLNEDNGFGPGNFPYLPAGLPNDSVTSVFLGSQVEIVLRSDTELGGFGLLAHGSQSNLGTNGFNDVTSSFYLQTRNARCNLQTGQVCLFQDSNFNTGLFTGGSKRGVGNYPTSMHMGIQNDSVSSMLIGSGVAVAVCPDANYGSCIGPLIPGQYPVPSTLGIPNDSLSSMQVYPSCRELNGGNRCGGLSSSGLCSCAATCAQTNNCCFDKLDVCH